MKKRLSVISIVLFSLSLVAFIMGLWAIGTGFNKKDSYYNSEYSYRASVNAYVGGDAYNYIINGTYFAGYCSLGGALFVVATIAGVSGVTWLENVETETGKEKHENEIIMSDPDETVLQNELDEEK